jgi:D-threo-aldose 1-dehydrogenase
MANVDDGRKSMMSGTSSEGFPTIELGTTGLRVSAVSLGTPRIGSDTEIGAQVSDEAASTAAGLLNGPFRVVDTSNSYGWGQSEKAIGRGIKLLGGLPPERIVMTKADRDRETGRFDGERVLRSFEESRERLGLDYFPIYHLHDPYTMTFGEAMAKGGAVEALVRLKEEGLVGSLGIAAGPIALLSDYLSTGIFDVLLTHNRYTLLDRSAEELIAGAAAAGVGVFNAAPFGGGLLAKGVTSDSTYAYEPVKPETLRWLTRLEAVCAAWKVELPTAALHFSMRNPNVSSTLVGTARVSRVDELQRMMSAVVPEGFWDDFAELGTPPLASDGVAVPAADAGAR